jgi:hypothetical protein
MLQGQQFSKSFIKSIESDAASVLACSVDFLSTIDSEIKFAHFTACHPIRTCYIERNPARLVWWSMTTENTIPDYLRWHFYLAKHA